MTRNDIKKYAAMTVIAVSLLFAAYHTFIDVKDDAVDGRYNMQVEKLVIESADGGKHSFVVEVAEKEADVENGLMYRKKMAKDAGMIFLMGKPAKEVKFWMKNTLIPLDMLFIAADGTIAHIHENAEPQSLTPISSEVPVTGVLELNGEIAKEMGIHEGDKVIYGYFQ